MTYKLSNIDFENTFTSYDTGGAKNPGNELKSGQHHFIFNAGGYMNLPNDLGTKTIEFVLTNTGTTPVYIYSSSSNIFVYRMDTLQGYDQASTQLVLSPNSTRVLSYFDNSWYEKYNANATLPSIVNYTMTVPTSYIHLISPDAIKIKSEVFYFLNTNASRNLMIPRISDTCGIGFKIYIKNNSAFNIPAYPMTPGSVDGTSKIDIAAGQNVVLIVTSDNLWTSYSLA